LLTLPLTRLVQNVASSLPPFDHQHLTERDQAEARATPQFVATEATKTPLMPRVGLSEQLNRCQAHRLAGT
jgi:hypothetical protein